MENVNENNRLIAEFMGYIPISETDFLGGNHNFIEGSEDFNRLHIYDASKYHTSWDWIMPVVQRIDEMGASVIIGRMFCDIKYEDPLNAEKHFDIRIASGVKMNAVHGAVVEFVKWHNTKRE